MASYQINRFNKALLTSVEEGTLDRTTDLKFIGKNYVGYGEIQNENFLFLLENFAGAQQPPRPISGQIWYDSATGRLKVYDGDRFRTTGGIEISENVPVNSLQGDFWWNSTTDQLYVYNGSKFILVGPQDTAGTGITQMQSSTIIDNNGVSQPVIKGIIDDAIVYIISNTEFTINQENEISGFSVIKKGLTLVNTDSSGTSSDEYVYWGSSSNSLKLNNRDASEYVLSSIPVFNNQEQSAQFENIGLKIGNFGHLYVEAQDQFVIENSIGGTIKFKAYDNTAQELLHSVTVSYDGIIPSVSSSINLGKEEYRWGVVYSEIFDGVATTSESVVTSGIEYRPSLGAVRNTIAIRDSSGDISANQFRGIATSAMYADLAEIYKTDCEYPVGTVICVGGKNEVTKANITDIPIGVISDSPAYLMNSESDGQAIGLKGRVPVRVIGSVSKGQAVYATDNGVASTLKTNGIVGIALETNNSIEEKLVECVLKV